MGHEAQRRMMISKVLLIGMSGLGAEVAKNCCLAGLQSLVLCDPSEVESFDLGGNFYLPQGHAPGGRASLVKNPLSQLNPYVQVSCADVDSLTVEHLLPLVHGMTCVVVTIPLPHAVLVALNDKCRELNCCFIYSLVTGVFSSVFCDFGNQFVVSDKDGNVVFMKTGKVAQGETVFTDRRCDALGATARLPPRTASVGNTGIYRAGCARRLSELTGQIRDALGGEARALFARILANDPEFADTAERMRQLGQ